MLKQILHLNDTNILIIQTIHMPHLRHVKEFILIKGEHNPPEKTPLAILSSSEAKDRIRLTTSNIWSSCSYSTFSSWECYLSLHRVLTVVLVTLASYQGRTQDLGGGYSKFEVVQKKKIYSPTYILAVLSTSNINCL